MNYGLIKWQIVLLLAFSSITYSINFDLFEIINDLSLSVLGFFGAAESHLVTNNQDLIKDELNAISSDSDEVEVQSNLVLEFIDPTPASGSEIESDFVSIGINVIGDGVYEAEILLETNLGIIVGQHTCTQMPCFYTFENLEAGPYVAVAIVREQGNPDIEISRSFTVVTFSNNNLLCECDSKDSCTQALNNQDCDEVHLTNDVTVSGIFLDDPEGFSNKRFSCNGHRISGSGSGTAIYLNQKTMNVILNCKIDNFDKGVHLDTSYRNIIKYNEFIGNGDSGINISGGSRNEVLLNKIYDNYVGVFVHDSSENFISNNLAFRNFEGIGLYETLRTSVSFNDISLSDKDGIFIHAGSKNEIYSNTVYKNSRAGLHLTGGTYENIIKDNSLYANQVVQMSGSTSIHSQIYNNTFNATEAGELFDLRMISTRNYWNTTVNCVRAYNAVTCGSEYLCTGGNTYIDSGFGHSETCTKSMAFFGICEESFSINEYENVDYLPLWVGR